ncbi:MAG: hypothetical protein ABIF06_02330 [bacterium]
MNTIIGADTAKLAGLQIDQLQKVRQGHITLEHLEWFNKLSRTQRDMLSGADLSKLGGVEPEKFVLLADLGIITVPEDYEHETRLADFRRAHGKKFYSFNDALTDTNFSNPSRVLKPGDRLAVTAYKQIMSGTTTSEERMTFLRSQGSVFTGAQGASLVFEQKRDRLPKGYWYASFDEPERFWVDADGYHRVPRVDAHSDGAFHFHLGFFEEVSYDHRALLCFRDLPK